MGLLFWPLVGALIGFVASQNRGFSPVAGILGGLLLGPLAFLMFFLTGVASKGDWGGDGTQRRCYFCKERIHVEARICRYCGKAVRPVVPGRRSA